MNKKEFRKKFKELMREASNSSIPPSEVVGTMESTKMAYISGVVEGNKQTDDVPDDVAFQ